MPFLGADRMRNSVHRSLALLVLAGLALSSQGAEPAASPAAPIWHTDYHAALDAAEAEQKLALLWLYDPHEASENEHFERHVLAQPAVAEAISAGFVDARLPRAVQVASDGRQITLLDHPAFAEMQHSAGLAIVDLRDKESPLFRQVVSVYPFTRGAITAEKIAVLLYLPPGSLTQRTLVFAVRTHPEHPASTDGHWSPILAHETQSHAEHQARILLQGHHQWESRFHSINAQLPGGLAAREVCAESWPGQGLLEAAEECVHSWRQSPGHWEAVSSRHPLFGYDMRRGANGVWYAAGIFASR
jgi:hypothetical protein